MVYVLAVVADDAGIVIVLEVSPSFDPVRTDPSFAASIILKTGSFDTVPLKLVMLSVFEKPLSVPAVRSGGAGLAGAVVSTVMRVPVA